jgi:hypothetical protein
MTNKILVAAIIGAVLALGTTGSAFAAASWQGVTSSSITPKNDQTTTLSVTATDTVPIHTDVLGGFAWIYSGGPDTAFVVVTHNGVRDSNQNPDGWHVHNVMLGGPGTVSAACIVSVSPDTTAGISIQGDTINVNVRNSELTSSLSGATVAFSIVGDPGCTSGLGVVFP